MKTVAKAVVLLIIAASVAAFLYQREQKKKSEPVSDSLTYYGNIEIRRVNLSFRVAGKIAEVFAEEGESLTKGQTFAKLDAEPLEVDVQLAQAALDQARHRQKRRQSTRIRRVAVDAQRRESAFGESVGEPGTLGGGNASGGPRGGESVGRAG